LSKIEKMILKMRNNPKNVDFDSITTVCEHFGCKVCNETGGSHYSITHPLIERTLVVPRHKPVKKPYVLDVLEMIDDIRKDTNNG